MIVGIFGAAEGDAQVGPSFGEVVVEHEGGAEMTAGIAHASASHCDQAQVVVWFGKAVVVFECELETRLGAVEVALGELSRPAGVEFCRLAEQRAIGHTGRAG